MFRFVALFQLSLIVLVVWWLKCIGGRFPIHVARFREGTALSKRLWILGLWVATLAMLVAVAWCEIFIWTSLSSS